MGGTKSPLVNQLKEIGDADLTGRERERERLVNNSRWNIVNARFVIKFERVGDEFSGFYVRLLFSSCTVEGVLLTTLLTIIASRCRHISAYTSSETTTLYCPVSPKAFVFFSPGKEATDYPKKCQWPLIYRLSPSFVYSAFVFKIGLGWVEHLLFYWHIFHFRFEFSADFFIFYFNMFF